MKQVFFRLTAFVFWSMVLAAPLAAEDALDPAAIDSQRSLPPQWASRQQQERCESLIEALQDRFFRVRHFEMRRHPCAISRQAQAFLKIAEECRRGCPQGFMEKKGFTRRVVRHVSWLDEENTPQCPP